MDDAAAQQERNRCHSEITEQAFRTMSDEDLNRCIDAFAHTGGGHSRGIADFRNELTRREREREGQRLADQTTALLRLTRVLAWLTAGLFVLEVLRIAGVVH
jgi:CHASE3 domain sensor protein